MKQQPPSPRVTLSALASFLLLAACSRPAFTPETHQVLLDDQVLYHVQYIDLSLRAGQWEQVHQIYTERLSRSPDDPVALFLAARTLEETNAAFKHYQKALELDPGNYWSLLGIGETYLEMSILPRAKESLQKAIEVNDAHPLAHAVLGEVYRKQNRRKEAIEAFRKAIDRDGSCYLARRGMAEIYLASGNRRSARRELQVAVAAAPRVFDIQLTLGELLEEEGMDAESFEAFRQATEINTNNARAWYGRARLARSLGRQAEAQDALEQVLELRSYHHLARRDLAHLLREKGEHERAAALYRDAITARADDLESRRGLALCYEAQGKLTEALSVYKALLDHNPGEAEGKTRFEALISRIGAKAEPLQGSSIQQVFDRILVAIQACHHHLRKADPELEGKLQAEVSINMKGHVDQVELLRDTSGSAELGACVLWTIGNARSPPDDPRSVSFPFELP